MTQKDYHSIIGEAHERLKTLRWEKEQLLEKARLWGLQLEQAGIDLQNNPASLAFNDESDAPANPRFTARADRCIFDTAALAALFQQLRTNQEHIKQKEAIIR